MRMIRQFFANNYVDFCEKVDNMPDDALETLWSSGKSLKSRKQILMALGTYFMKQDNMKFFYDFEADFNQLNFQPRRITKKTLSTLPSVLMTRIWSFLDLFQLPEISGL